MSDTGSCSDDSTDNSDSESESSDKSSEASSDGESDEEEEDDGWGSGPFDWDDEGNEIIDVKNDEHNAKADEYDEDGDEEGNDENDDHNHEMYPFAGKYIAVRRRQGHERCCSIKQLNRDLPQPFSPFHYRRKQLKAAMRKREAARVHMRTVLALQQQGKLPRSPLANVAMTAGALHTASAVEAANVEAPAAAHMKRGRTECNGIRRMACASRSGAVAFVEQSKRRRM